MFCNWYGLYLQDEVINTGETQVEDTLLEGHLGITRELLAFQSADKKYQMGSEKGGANLVKVLHYSIKYYFAISAGEDSRNHCVKRTMLILCENVVLIIKSRVHKPLTHPLKFC